MASPGSGSPPHQHTILVVDDSWDTCEALAMVLELAGYRVAPMASSVQALDLMTELAFRPCVVIVDLIMPTMDGLTLRTEMLKDPDLASIPAIALTGHEPLRRQALGCGFAAALLKPCDMEELLSATAETCPVTAASTRAQRA